MWWMAQWRDKMEACLTVKLNQPRGACHLDSSANAAAPTPTTAIVNRGPSPRDWPLSAASRCNLSEANLSGRPH